jgi:hypothetical protein
LRIYGTAESRALSKHQPKMLSASGAKARHSGNSAGTAGFQSITGGRAFSKHHSRAVAFQNTTDRTCIFKASRNQQSALSKVPKSSELNADC